MRCFIAVELPEEIKRELSKVQEQLKSEDIKATFVKPDILHFTLKFLGELSDEQVNQVKQVLSNVKFENFKVKLNNLGVFPTEQFIRVLWAAIEPKENLIELQKEIESELEKIGFKREKNFETHITIARVKFVKDKSALLKKLKDIKLKPAEFEISGFSLRKSTLTPQGPIYKDVAVF